MIANINVNAQLYRAPSLSYGLSRQAVRRSEKSISGELKRPLVLGLAFTLVMFSICAQLISWQIEKTSGRIAQIQAERSFAGSENIKLLASRARLLSETRLITVAGVKFDLHVPDKGQVSRL